MFCTDGWVHPSWRSQCPGAMKLIWLVVLKCVIYPSLSVCFILFLFIYAFKCVNNIEALDMYQSHGLVRIAR